MEDGLTGRHGQCVAKLVDPGHKLDTGGARSHGLNMAEGGVQEQHENNGCATRVHVLVRK